MKLNKIYISSIINNYQRKEKNTVQPKKQTSTLTSQSERQREREKKGREKRQEQGQRHRKNKVKEKQQPTTEKKLCMDKTTKKFRI